MDSAVVIAEIQKSLEASDDSLIRMFNALGDPTRFRIFYSLCAANDICVTELARIIQISVPAASQQLKLLEMVDLTVRKRSGQKICYEVNYQHPMVADLVSLMNTHM